MGMFAAALNGSAISVGISGTWFDDVMQYQMDYRVFAYLLAVSVGTGLLFGFAPASRLARVDVNDALKDQARGTFGGGAGEALVHRAARGRVGNRGRAAGRRGRHDSQLSQRIQGRISGLTQPTLGPHLFTFRPPGTGASRLKQAFLRSPDETTQNSA